MLTFASGVCDYEHRKPGNAHLTSQHHLFLSQPKRSYTWSRLLGWIEKENRRHSHLEDESFDVQEYPDYYYDNASADALGGLVDDYDSDEAEDEDGEEHVHPEGEKCQRLQQAMGNDAQQCGDQGDAELNDKENLYGRIPERLKTGLSEEHAAFQLQEAESKEDEKPSLAKEGKRLRQRIENVLVEVDHADDKENIQRGLFASKFAPDLMREESGQMNPSERTAADDEETWELFEDAEEESLYGLEEQKVDKSGTLFRSSIRPPETAEDAVSFSSPVRRLLAVEA